MPGYKGKKRRNRSGSTEIKISPENKKQKSVLDMFKSGPDKLDTMAECGDTVNGAIMKATDETMKADQPGGEDMLSLLKDILKQVKPIPGIVTAIDDIKSKLDGLTTKVDDHETRITTVEQQSAANFQEIADLKKTVETLQISIPSNNVNLLKLKNEKLENKIDAMENHSRRENIIFNGIAESEAENCKSLVYDVLVDNLKITDARDRIKFTRVHRIGKLRLVAGKPDQKPRPIIARVMYYPHKLEIMDKRKLLYANENGEDAANEGASSSNIYIFHNYSEKVRRARRALGPVLKKAREYDNSAHLHEDKLLYKGNQYQIHQLYDLDFNVDDIHTQVKMDYVSFLGRLSPLSNFHPVNIVIDGQAFNCVEQFYQYCKAVKANQLNIANEILLTDDPVQMKRLGDRLQIDQWHGKTSDDVMRTALLAKFNLPRFRRYLKSTEQRTIVEANKYDRYWACGLSSDNPNIRYSKSWQGKNKMGELLMNIRDMI